ncbi:MAG: SIMPL domain-containing protein [Patescibacteria group bacterium]|nr:SIMPL domain-containing protein [Patescibacteria group bacterium]MDE1940799.1 SIMPL domain-containing protein [Patescibacteria group bacterium]MDE1966749.1 SIMPL domain-containing protein [Patescibacteria group bacterium]
MNAPSKFWTVATYFLVVLIIGAVLVGIRVAKSIAYVGANPNLTNTINVDGTGDAYAVPDVATFSFSVIEDAKTVADAQTAATAKSNAALKAVKDAGVADKDIQTTGYSITPQYEYQNAVCPQSSSVGSPVYCPSGRRILTGYEVSQTTTVKVRDLSKAGDLFSAIGGLGVQNVSDLQFSVDNPDSVKAEARDKAIADAQSKASELAKQLGVSLVRIVSFTESSGPQPIVYGLGMKANAAMAPSAAPVPEVNPGQQKVTDNVEITYQIE